MFQAALRLSLARAIRWGLKWALRRAQNIFMPYNINCITIMVFLEWQWGNKNWKKKMTSLKNISFTNAVRKHETNTVMASPFWLPAYIIRLFDSHFSLVYFSRQKYILAHQILHFSPQNVPQCTSEW